MGIEGWSFVVAVLALFTAGWVGIYARSQAASARGQLEVAQQVRREQNEPYVLVTIRPQESTPGLLVLVVQNTGPTMARDVKITCSPDLSSSIGDDVTEALQSALARTIAMLPPGQRLEYLFDTGRRFQSDLPMVFEFTVEAQGPMGPVEPLHYVVDLHSLTEALMGERPTKQLEKELEKISNQFKEFVKSYETANQQEISATVARRREEWQRRNAERERGNGADE
ncbi:hypothetical protein [Streptomyces sp. NPDC058657]|uniref:hypothetical protein n=1 Tax=unclassified Streptomyces TaxID=2593676 RepID=UPI0036499C39